MNAFFYPSVNGDRVYDATAFEHWLKKFFTTGVFLNDLQVTANDDMTVNVGIGYSNVDGKVKIFEEDTTLQIETAGATYPRIDSIVLERNDTERDVFLKVIKGGYSSEPIAHVPVRQDGVYQLVIAQILVNAGAVKISQLDITDTRSDKELCGIVAGAVDQIDFSQIQAQFDAYMTQYAEYIADYSEQMQADFDAWFENIRNQLDEDAAGHLQNQIDEMKEELENVGGSRVEVTVDDNDYNVVGLTVKLEINGQTYSKVVPIEKKVVFQVLEIGTANISCVDEAQGYNKASIIDISCYSAYEVALGSGGFKGWLEAGGYTEAQYPTVADVLADENALRNLMTDKDACVAFVAWYNEENSMLAEFAESSIAMECIGASDYISNKLLAIPSASEQLLESEYWEYILKDKVPAMTSNTSPEGTVFCSSAHSSYPAYKAFNQTNVDNADMWMATDNCAYPQYLGYAFTRPICVSKVLIANRNANNTINAVGTFKIQGSNKSDFSTIEFETEVMTHAGPTKALEEIYTVNSDKACVYWRICVLSCNEKILGLGENVAIGKLQFYGRLYSPESDNEDDVLTSADVVDNLLSDRGDLPLSARMGSELNKNFNVRYNPEKDTVEIFYNGVWNEWKSASLQTLYLYNNGDECLDITGGYTASAVYGFNLSGSTYAPTITRNANTLQIVGKSSSFGSVFGLNAIDLTGYKTAKIKVVDNSASNADLYIGFTQSKSNGYTGSRIGIVATGEYNIDISTLEGNYFIAMCYVGAANVLISEIKLLP